MTSPFEQSVGRAAAALEQAKKARGEARLVELSLDLAKALLDASTTGAEAEERARAARLGALMRDRTGQVFATALTDRVHRSTSGARLVGQVRQLIDAFGVPKSLTRWDRLELRALQAFGANAPELTARAVRRRIHEDASPYIVPADPAALDAFLAERRAQHVQVNVNHLGEEVLGKADEARYLQTYISLLERPEVDTISVKLSSIDCRLDLLAWEETLGRLAQKLERIYRAARDNSARSDGDVRPKLVYLDMENYRELELTFALFERVLGAPAFRDLSAGVVLQAYLPDSFGYQQRLVKWASERVAAGGAPVRMRLVKGANLMLERIESSLKGWELAPYGSKHEVDANFKRMLRFALVPEHARAVHVGFGSHNLFDIAYALVLRAAAGLEHEVEPEMLEGMADPLRRVVQRVAGRVLVYAPSVSEREFSSAVAYLVRRLDENTSEENFLRRSFAMQSDDESFEHERRRFLAALSDADRVGTESHRRQNRLELAGTPRRAHFANEPDTDFSRAANRAWLAQHLERERALRPVLVSRVAGKALSGRVRDGFDPSRPGVVPYTYAALEADGVRHAVEHAHANRAEWSALPAEEREAALLSVAEALRRARGELVAKMVLDAGKRALEADAEVSEAIDFAEYYARQHARLRERFELAPKGLVVVTPPWNFPLAIGLGNALAALVAGNVVLLKPPPETLLV
ncbi:MAG TPA: bifunctional proline dehydrogenase/L-glutamate gamma-semialdehyde dehydrogenase, partial [Polyangiaceae bacterium]